MEPFDVIMQYCPYLKEIIENKIASEVQTRDTKIQELEAKTEQQENAILELTATILMGGILTYV